MSRRVAAPLWMEELARSVWASDRLAEATQPRVRLGPPARSTRGYINYAHVPFRIVVRSNDDELVMRSTLLHELAHAVHRMHATDAASCRCETRCTWDAHGATFKTHLADLEHRYTPGKHSRWGVAGCRGLTRVPAGTPWHSEIPCPSERPVVVAQPEAVPQFEAQESPPQTGVQGAFAELISRVARIGR